MSDRFATWESAMEDLNQLYIFTTNETIGYS